MARRAPLPAHLGAAFIVSDALAAGVTPGRLRSDDLDRPFRGARAIGWETSTLQARRELLALRLPAGAVFSHVTAAMLWGAPLPLALEASPGLHVSTLDPRRPPEIRGVVAHQISTRGGTIRRIGPLRVTSPVLTWCLLAPVLSVPDLVAVADHLLSGDRPLATIAQLEAGVAASAGQRGATRLVKALPLVRVGPRSRPESHARLLYRAAGLPEPELNGVIRDERGRRVAESDLIWREEKVANEYEGAYHQERGRFRTDILRRERVEDLGWRLSRFTSDDIHLRPEETVRRMANRLGVGVTGRGVAAAIALVRTIGR